LGCGKRRISTTAGIENTPLGSRAIPNIKRRGCNVFTNFDRVFVVTATEANRTENNPDIAFYGSGVATSE